MFKNQINIKDSEFSGSFFMGFHEILSSALI